MGTCQVHHFIINSSTDFIASATLFTGGRKRDSSLTEAGLVFDPFRTPFIKRETTEGRVDFPLNLNYILLYFDQPNFLWHSP
jgi:hypothetical protein